MINQKLSKLEKLKDYIHNYGVVNTVWHSYCKAIGKDKAKYRKWLNKHLSSEQELEKQKNTKFEYMPKFSIVVPLYKTPIEYLYSMIDSVLGQSYANWELLLSDGSGHGSNIKQLIAKKYPEDDRINCFYDGKQRNISDNTNVAIENATGDYVVFMDHDDLITKDALFYLAYYINNYIELNPSKKNENESNIEYPDCLYSDEDKVDMKGEVFYEPHFKTDFNIDLLCSMNYFCHLVSVKKSFLDKVGMLRSEFNGAQDYDFVLRCVEKANMVIHISRILYHWRAFEDSTAGNPESKRYAFENGVKALEEHYKRIGIDATVKEGESPGLYVTKYKLKKEPIVSIIIQPENDNVKLCIESIKKQLYSNYEIILVSNGKDFDTKSFFDKGKIDTSNIKLVTKNNAKNIFELYNWGVQNALGEYILFLNCNAQMIKDDCIEQLLSLCMRDDVGVVGTKILYKDNRINSAGIIIEEDGMICNAFENEPEVSVGYFSRIICSQNLSAVPSFCMMVSKKAYKSVDGFDEKYIKAISDIDFCLKIREKNFLIVYNPNAVIYNLEKKLKTRKKIEKEILKDYNFFKGKWKKFLKQGDPFYNCNLSRNFNIK